MANAKTLTMETREEPRFVNFKIGDAIEGALLGIEEISIQGKRAIRYTLQEPDVDMLVCFIGTHQLNSKIRPGDIGHYLQIRCEGEDQMVKRGDNCMKIFDVKVSKEQITGSVLRPSLDRPLGDGTGITDDDIPF